MGWLAVPDDEDDDSPAASGYSIAHPAPILPVCAVVMVATPLVTLILGVPVFISPVPNGE